jgi:hypothetical protein
MASKSAGSESEVKAPGSGAGKPAAKSKSSDTYARAFARAAAEVSAPKIVARRVAGAIKPAPAAKPKKKAGAKPKSAAGSTATAAATTAKSEEKARRDAEYKNLVNPEAQEARRKQHLDAFRKLQIMSMDELQVEFVVCVRAQHYRDALMYSEIIMEKDPNNALVAQFQPLLANLAVSATEALVEESESSGSGDESGDGGEGGGGDDGGDGSARLNNEEEAEGGGESSDDSSDDPETAWMWSETWRTDPDDAPAPEGAAPPARGPAPALA